MGKAPKKNPLGVVGTSMQVTGAALVPVKPVAGAALSIGGKLLTGIAKAYALVQDHRRAELKKMLELACEANWSDEGFEAAVDAETAKNLNFAETIHTTARAYQDRVSEAVLPAVALLFREYHRTGRLPDRFYRSMLVLLCEMDQPEFRTLQELMITIDDGIFTTAALGEYVFRAQPQRATADFTFEVANNLGAQTAFNTGYPLRTPQLRQVFRSLVQHELARGSNAGGLDVPAEFSITRPEISRLRQLVSPRTKGTE